MTVSIHAPRVGCDPQRSRLWSRITMFQSTHPVWGATAQHRSEFVYSIGFNPRTPCGVRPGVAQCHNTPRQVSIHAPRVGCDLSQVI